MEDNKLSNASLSFNEFDFHETEVEAIKNSVDTNDPLSGIDLMALTDDNLTHEVRDLLQSMGIPKPTQISWPAWIGPKEISPKHELLIHLKASGLTNNQVAEALGMSPARISIIVNSPKVKSAIKVKQEAYFGSDHRDRMNKLMPKVFGVFEGILANDQEKANVRLDAAKYIADQTMGKAQQNVKMEGSAFSEFFSKLDQLSNRDVTPATETTALDLTKDPLENFIEEVIPQNLIVGKRSE